ncbi:IS3 family transposase [Notoacmeibacter marinus]|uniref:IS3 family transposase n=1 Tax=Notoacmeibacter marinus TaxID=1876515 RepID=UPI000B8C6254|nr:IS3 family transposase [Notoacmeibacter marinus]
MGTSNYSDEFKRDAVHQIMVRGYPVREVSRRLGVSTHSLYKWMKLFGDPKAKEPGLDHAAENRRLKRELARVTEERDILKKANGVLRARVPMKYAFIRAHREEFGIRAMCRVLRVHFSGFYAWLKEPLSHRAQEDVRQTELIRQAWTDSGKVYGYRKLTDDLRDQGEQISEIRVARLASLAGIAAQIGYRRRPGRYGGKPAIVAENRLEQRFDASQPDRVWVTDITYIKTHEGWLSLCVVIDLFSRRVVGWSTQSRMTTDLALQALLMAVWRRKPAGKVMVHSDQGSQFTSWEWQTFLRQHNLEPSMSRRRNCHDNAVAESFFQLLKRERIRRRTYPTRDDARGDVFEYIELFYNPKRKHTYNGMLSPVDFEIRQRKLNEAGV